jgi:hypothetical protein
VSGCALILDYVLTIAISIASGVDALASFLPLGFQPYKLWAEAFFIGLLIVMNLRGLKEAIQILLPIFLGFVATHLVLIVYGIVAHASTCRSWCPTPWRDARAGRHIGWAGVAGMLLLAYSQGGGTYTGLEAVSNNVNLLAEPRVRTGKMTMFYMALSLAVTAGGIILLYLLWDARPVAGETLNATTFRSIIASMGLGGEVLNQMLLAVVLAFEAGLLFVAANTGFLGGPSVLSNMAGDSWVPHQFRYLSTRLVTQNGILVMGIAALAILFWTGGQVTLLVVLYSISVFLTFAISLFGLCLYWWRHRKDARWVRRFLLSLVGFVICAGILAILLVERFTQGGWATALIIAAIAGLCIFIRNHYRETKRAIRSVDRVFANQPFGPVTEAVEPEPEAQTAVFIVGNSRGGGLHALLWVLRMFPGPLQELPVRERAHGGLACLRRRGRAGEDAQGCGARRWNTSSTSARATGWRRRPTSASAPMRWRK